MLYLEKIPAAVRPAFAQAVTAMSQRLRVHPDWLMTVFYRESKLNPAAVNAWQAAGLIQITPTTARDIHTTTAQILNASYVGQLVYVERYYAMRIRQHGLPKSVYDLYLLTFYPPAMGTPDNHILFKSGNIAYERNKGLDNFPSSSKKGYIATRDIKAFVNAAIPKNYTPSTPPSGTSSGKSQDWMMIGSVLLLAAGIWLQKSSVFHPKQPSYQTNENVNA